MDIKKGVYEVIEQITEKKKKKVTQQLNEDMGFDSLKMVLLIILLEEKFTLELNESDMNPFVLETVDDVIALVKKYKGENV